MNLLLILNPGSRAGRGKRRWAAWQAGLRAAGVPFEARVTDRPGRAAEWAAESGPADTVVAVGGDGTINEVLDGLLRSDRPDRRMGVLYAGTSPDFCRFHGIPVEPAAALAALLRNQVRSVDVARIACRTETGAPIAAHFACGCNIGLGPAVAARSNRLRRIVGDAAGTGLAAVLAILTERPVALEGTIDGAPFAWPAVRNLSVLKNPFMASGLRAGAAPAPADGNLLLVAVTGVGRLGLLRLLPRFYRGRLSGASGIVLKPCHEITIKGTSAVPLEYDGDPRGFLPARIEIRPRALNLLGGAP